MRNYPKEYRGKLRIFSLNDFVRSGEGDDFIVVMDEPVYQGFSALVTNANLETLEDRRALIETNEMAQALVSGRSGVSLVGVEEDESSKPRIFAQEVEHDGKTYILPTIFNAKLCKPSEDGNYSEEETYGYSLRLGNYIDPEHHCKARIVYAPGRRITWNSVEVAQAFSGV